MVSKNLQYLLSSDVIRPLIHIGKCRENDPLPITFQEKPPLLVLSFNILIVPFCVSCNDIYRSTASKYKQRIWTVKDWRKFKDWAVPGQILNWSPHNFQKRSKRDQGSLYRCTLDVYNNCLQIFKCTGIGGLYRGTANCLPESLMCCLNEMLSSRNELQLYSRKIILSS